MISRAQTSHNYASRRNLRILRLATGACWNRIAGHIHRAIIKVLDLTVSLLDYAADVSTFFTPKHVLPTGCTREMRRKRRTSVPSKTCCGPSVQVKLFLAISAHLDSSSVKPYVSCHGPVQHRQSTPQERRTEVPSLYTCLTLFGSSGSHYLLVNQGVLPRMTRSTICG